MSLVLAATEVCLDEGPRFATSGGGLFTAASLFNASAPFHPASSLVLVGTHQTTSCWGALPVTTPGTLHLKTAIVFSFFLLKEQQEQLRNQMAEQACFFPGNMDGTSMVDGWFSIPAGSQHYKLHNRGTAGMSCHVRDSSLALERANKGRFIWSDLKVDFCILEFWCLHLWEADALDAAQQEAIESTFLSHRRRRMLLMSRCFCCHGCRLLLCVTLSFLWKFGRSWKSNINITKRTAKWNRLSA